VYARARAGRSFFTARVLYMYIDVYIVYRHASRLGGELLRVVNNETRRIIARDEVNIYVRFSFVCRTVSRITRWRVGFSRRRCATIVNQQHVTRDADDRSEPRNRIGRYV